MVTRGTSKERLREEIAKCDVLCGNCHRARRAEATEEAPAVELRRRPLRFEPVDGSGSLDARQRKRRWV